MVKAFVQKHAWQIIVGVISCAALGGFYWAMMRADVSAVQKDVIAVKAEVKEHGMLHAQQVQINQALVKNQDQMSRQFETMNKELRDMNFKLGQIASVK